MSVFPFQTHSILIIVQFLCVADLLVCLLARNVSVFKTIGMPIITQCVRGSDNWYAY